MAIKNFINPELLEDNADRVEKMRYSRPFSHPEIQERQGLLADVSITIGTKEAEKKEINAKINAELKVSKQERDKLVSELKAKAESVEEECFKFIYEEDNTAAYYNQEGKLVFQRPLMPDEGPTIFSVSRRTGTDDE